MNRHLLPLLVIVALALPARSAVEKPAPWPEDPAAALTQATPARLVLANFTGSDWVEGSRRLRDEILSRAYFLDYARDHLVLVELDFPRNKQLPPEQAKVNLAWAKKYRIASYPTLLVLDPTGRELGRLGYMQGGPKTFVRELRRIAAQAGPAAGK